jgi:hypothetical protein
MGTPTYKGQGQPTASSGGSWLSNWFGNSTPAYLGPSTATANAPAAKTAATTNANANVTPPDANAAPAANVLTLPRSFFAFAAPAYKLGSADSCSDASADVNTDASADIATSTEIAIVIPRQAIDPTT